jgi:LysM repeat protein
MGNLEKAGIAVVVALLGIILVVAFVTDPAAPGSGDGTAPPVPQAPAGESLAAAPRSPLERAREGLADAPLVGTVPPRRPLREIPVLESPTSGLEAAGGDAASRSGGTSAAAPAGTPAPARPTGFPRTVELGKDESLWLVATREYGPGVGESMVSIIQQANGISDPRALQPGMKLTLPAPPEGTVAASKPGPEARPTPARTGAPAVAGGGHPAFPPFDPRRGSGGSKDPQAPASTTSREYVVRPNETLHAIARRQLGSVRYVSEIVRLNGLSNPDSIQAGMRLQLPERRP